MDRKDAVPPLESPAPQGLPPGDEAFYRHVLELLNAAGVPYLVGGAYAFNAYTGIERHTRDIDLFVRRADFERVAQALAPAGYETELTYPHWLGKVRSGEVFVDLVFNSGNGLTAVDAVWFERAADAVVLGVPVRIVPVEEMIWSKAFVMERERYDGADVAHLLRARAGTLDWPRLLERVGPHWRVLLSHLVLFGFIYPAERERVPAWLMERLLERLREEMGAPAPQTGVCGGTLLSREQYLPDVHRQGYGDARQRPFGTMSAEDIAAWTEAIPSRQEAAAPPGEPPPQSGAPPAG